MSTPTLWETIQPHLDVVLGTIMPLVTLAAAAWVRNLLQHKGAAKAVMETEDEAPYLGLLRDRKLRHARAKVRNTLGPLTRPLTKAGENALIESEVTKLQVSKSMRPPVPPGR